MLQFNRFLLDSCDGKRTSGTEKRVSSLSKKVPAHKRDRRRPSSLLAVPGGPMYSTCSCDRAARSSSRTYDKMWKVFSFYATHSQVCMACTWHVLCLCSAGAPLHFGLDMLMQAEQHGLVLAPDQ